MSTPITTGTISRAITPPFSSSRLPPTLPCPSSTLNMLSTEKQGATTFLSLPPELHLQILLHLTPDPSSLRACKLTCAYLHTLIHTSLHLIYHAALHATQQDDNPVVQMPIAEKMAWLEESANRWAVLDLDQAVVSDSEAEGTIGGPKSRRMRKLTVNHVTSGIYDLTGGVYLLGDLLRQTLYWVKLPGRDEVLEESKGEEELKWNKIDLEVLRQRSDSDGRERKIVDMGLCVYEHDLIAIITVSPHPTTNNSPSTTNDIDMMLLQFSTGLPHPLLAKSQPYLRHICSTPTEWFRPAIGVEIVGDNLVLVLYYPNAMQSTPNDQVYIWDWKSGVLKLSFTVPNNTYSGLIFITPQLILLPNTQTNSLDVLRIPDKPTVNRRAHEPIVSLCLPALAPGRDLGSLSCRAEPNPVGDGHSSSYTRSHPDKGKHPARCATDQPKTLNLTPSRPFLPSPETALCFFSMRVIGAPIGQPNTHFGNAFTFMVHRNALVDVVQRWVPNLGADIDEDNDSAMPGSFAWSEPTRIPYASWGPSITRWFNSESIPTRWITTTCGQRCVLTAASVPTRGFPYVVLDFGKDSGERIGGAVRRENERERLEEMEKEREELEVREKARRSKGNSRLRKLREERAKMERATTVAPESESGSAVAAGAADLSSSSASQRNESRAQVSALDTDPDMFEEMVVDWDQVVASGPESPAATTSTNDITATVERQHIIDIDLEQLELQLPFPSDEEDEEKDDEDDEAPPRFSRTPSPSAGPSESQDPSASASASSSSGPTIGATATQTSTPPLPLHRLWSVTTSETVEPAETFAEPVEGALPYVACASQWPYTFSGVLLDEERVIGIKSDPEGRIKSIEVHYFG